jgi:hypothetical protein
MQRLKTFIHQKRFFQEQDHASSPVSPVPELQQIEDEWEIIDHREVEDHRLKWQGRFDRIVYLLAAVFIIYVLFQWLAH